MLKNCFTLLLLSFTLYAVAQEDTTTSDGLFQAARYAAFENKDYNTAKRYCLKALDISPKYADIRIFLGRLYTWTDRYDSAKYCFLYVLFDRPDYEDASIALIDLQYWNDENFDALETCEKALKFNPQSIPILTRKAKILTALNKYTEAGMVVTQILKIDKTNSDARKIAENIKDLTSTNKIGIAYDYTTFDKQFSDPWHIVGLDFSTRTKIGSVVGRINYANRFASNGVQYEMDAYPKINKTFYSYISFGYSDNVGVFPKYRAGFSLYANLPKSYEAEAGVRYLYFSSSNLIYTAYIGKYISNWLLGARTYLSGGSTSISQSYNINARYYYGSGADDFIFVNVGTGISPDERANNIQLNSKTKLSTTRASATWRFSVAKYHVFNLGLSWLKTEYLPNTIGNQVELSFGYTKRF